jgi:PPOX class probable F420-dependent enzyme
MSEATVVPDEFKDLLEMKTAILATNGASGLPQVTAIAFLYDQGDGLVKISLNDSRQKAKNMKRDPRATLFIIDPANQYRTLEIRAEAEVRPDPDFAECARIGAKYGTDFRVHDGPGETRSVITLHPVRVVATRIG